MRVCAPACGGIRAGVCDGMARFPAWHVFWIGVPPSDLPATIDYAMSLPEDFASQGL